MKTKKIMALLTVAVLFLLNACKEDEKVKPSAPQISSDVSTLPVKFGENKNITISISSAGKFKELSVSADKGLVEAKNISGVGTATGSAQLSYTAPFEEGAAKITLKAIDQTGQESTMAIDVTITSLPPVELTGGDVEGTWGPSQTYIVRGNIKVPKGKTLTIKEGVTVIVEGDGTQANSPEIAVYGKLYSYGTEAKPVLFTVAESKRTEANIFAGFWGGIAGVEDVEEMAFIYTRIEYVGAPAPANSPMVTTGEVDEGDPRYSIYFNNPKGKFLMLNSTIANSKDDGMRVNQGQLLIANNTFINNGKTGGEAINLKSGTIGDVAFNIIISAATNGVKWSNSDNRSPQTDINVYNNTVLNSGWRQTKSGRGGSFNLEKGARGKSYNNLIVNCRFGTRFPKSPDNPDEANSSTGYNLYCGNKQEIVDQFYPSAGSIVKGGFETGNDIAGVVNENDPKFVSFDIASFDPAIAKDAATIKNVGTYNLKLQPASPALAKGKTGFTSRLASLIVDGKTYTVPQPNSTIGALGN